MRDRWELLSNRARAARSSFRAPMRITFENTRAREELPAAVDLADAARPFNHCRYRVSFRARVAFSHKFQACGDLEFDHIANGNNAHIRIKDLVIKKVYFSIIRITRYNSPFGRLMKILRFDVN